VREESRTAPTPALVERLRVMEAAQAETRAKLAEVIEQRDDLATREAELEAARRLALQRAQAVNGGAAWPRRAVEEAREMGDVVAAAPLPTTTAQSSTVRPAVRPVVRPNGAAPGDEDAPKTSGSPSDE
jgi:hypothetical protein